MLKIPCSNNYKYQKNHGALVNNTVKLHSTKLEPRISIGSNPVRCVSEIRYGEDL